MTPLKKITCYVQWFGTGKRFVFDNMLFYRIVKPKMSGKPVPMLNLFSDRDGGNPKKIKSYMVEEIDYKNTIIIMAPSTLPGKPDLIMIQGEEIRRILKEEGLLVEPEHTEEQIQYCCGQCQIGRADG